MWRAIITELRYIYQTPGSTGHIGMTREWTAHDSHSQAIHATLPDGGDASTSAISQHVESLGQGARAASATLFILGVLLSVFYFFRSDIAVSFSFMLAAFLSPLRC